MSLTVIIPVFNEEACIKKTIQDLSAILETSDISAFEILVVNDASTDATARELAQSDVPYQVITHRRNKGYGASLKTGLRHAQYEHIAIIDADGTYPAQKIPEMYSVYRSHHLDMLVGARTGEHVSYPFIKKIPKFFLTRLANYITDTTIPDLNSGLRIFRKDIAFEFFTLYPNGFSFTTTITLAMLCRGYEVEYMPIDYFTRSGKSKISPIKDTLGFFTLLSQIAVFFNPLKVFLPFVGFLAFISLVFMIKDVFIVQNLSQSSVLFPILTVLIFFMGLMADMISKK